MEIHPLSDAPIPDGYIRLRTAGPSMQFQGALITTSSSDITTKPVKPQWTELELYRKTDGSNDYVLHVIARSVVYHAERGCDNGVRVNLHDLATRYLNSQCEEPVPEPCTVCRPQDIEDENIAQSVVVSAEVDWHTVYVCRTVNDLLTNLRQTKGPKAGQFGMPALILLERARAVDSILAAELDEVQTI